MPGRAGVKMYCSDMKNLIKHSAQSTRIRPKAVTSGRSDESLCWRLTIYIICVSSYRLDLPTCPSNEAHEEGDHQPGHASSTVGVGSHCVA
jgi:hypothetical protein